MPLTGRQEQAKAELETKQQTVQGQYDFMEDFLNRLGHKAYQKRKVGIIENGSWAPVAAKSMKAILDTMKDLTICDTVVSIKSTMKDADVAAMNALADELLK